MQTHKLSIRPRDPEQPLSAFNSVVEIDGRPMLGLRNLSFELDASRGSDLCVVRLELYSSLDLSGIAAFEEVNLKLLR